VSGRGSVRGKHDHALCSAFAEAQFTQPPVRLQWLKCGAGPHLSRVGAANFSVWNALHRDDSWGTGRYRKIYEDYKPAYNYWKLVLLTRKLLFALIVVLLDNNVEVQVGLASSESSCMHWQSVSCVQRHALFYGLHLAVSACSSL
jgi:hypothetical protein